MSRATEIIKFLQNYNAWRRGDETLQMPHPAEIGKNIQDAIVLLRKNAELEAELAKERARLDWLESPSGMDWQWEPTRLTVSRASIDAAMQEGAT
jgi:hypothetical protein